MLGFKAFDAAQCTLAGVELMHMIKKRQMVVETGDEGLTTAELFYWTLAFFAVLRWLTQKALQDRQVIGQL